MVIGPKGYRGRENGEFVRRGKWDVKDRTGESAIATNMCSFPLQGCGGEIESVEVVFIGRGNLAYDWNGINIKTPSRGSTVHDR